MAMSLLHSIQTLYCWLMPVNDVVGAMEPGRPASSAGQGDPAAGSGLAEPSSSQDGNPSLHTSLGAEESVILVPRGDLLQLPAEIIDKIFRSLSPVDLSSMAATCRRFRDHSKKDLLWHEHVQRNVPGCVVKSPFPYDSWRDLYIALDPYWFLPKYKLWFSDFGFTGRLILVRYDPRRACIEGYRLVAERKATEFESWQHDDGVIIHSFEPKVLLHKDLPILQLDTPGYHISGQSRYSLEIQMNIGDRSQRSAFSNIMLARPVDAMFNMSLWPPLIIPARHRVHNASPGNFTSTGHKPQKRSDFSDQTFRIRQWVQMLRGHEEIGVRLAADDVQTYSTLDPKLYTPTADKPYRGIWIGDYAAHGGEFLLLHQPDDKVPFNENSLAQREDETQEEYLKRKWEERVYRGRIEAIKLTGDPNVPRGEYTFIAEDIGKDGLVRVAQDTKFKGARIVKSRGHVAERPFRNDTFIDSQLIMISADLLAQYWVGFGHISFFQRVNIDEFLNPYEEKSYERPMRKV